MKGKAYGYISYEWPVAVCDDLRLEHMKRGFPLKIPIGERNHNYTLEI